MDELAKVIDWFLKQGGKYGNNGFLDEFDGNDSWETIKHTDLHEIHYRRLQIFVANLPDFGDNTKIELQYLLDHSRYDDDADDAINKAIKNLEPMLPEGAKFEISSSVGTNIFLIRVLSHKDLEPENLDQILTTLTDFAEVAMKRVSILYTAPRLEKVLKHYGLAPR